MRHKARTCLHCGRTDGCRCVPGFSIADWRRAPSAPSYEVSAAGQVRSWRSHPKPRILKGCLLKSGSTRYPAASVLSSGGHRSHRTVHSLVAEVFIGPRPAKMQVRHLDGNSMNPTAENLTYGTKSENEHDKIRHGTNPNANKTHCPRGHEYSPDNTYSSRGGRGCRECRRVCRRARDGSGPRRLDYKTHCVHGHEWTPENTALRSDGSGRHCRTCANEARRKPRRPDLDTHCPNGHERNAANTHARPNGGGFQCRVCERDRRRATRAAKADQ